MAKKRKRPRQSLEEQRQKLLAVMDATISPSLRTRIKEVEEIAAWQAQPTIKISHVGAGDAEPE